VSLWLGEFEEKIKMPDSKIKISAIVIAKNEEEKIKGCLESLKWVDECGDC